jgi:Na+-driven multidrug efflux pump
VAGGAIAGLCYYAVGCVVLIFYLWTRRGVLAPAATPPALYWRLSRDILRIGLVACIITVTTNLTVAVATALVSVNGPAAIAGYGVGARLEYLLIPVAFGFGAPLVAMVGTAVGAGRRERALKVAWLGAAVCGIITGVIGLTAATFPKAWMTLFGSDPVMIDIGTRYLQIVGPAYGFFGAGMVLYFASQGAGRLLWPLIGGLSRLSIATIGGWLLFRLTGNIDSVFFALAAALVTFAVINATAVYFGAWFVKRH